METSGPTEAWGPPVKKQGLQRTVYQRIRKGILTGAIGPGGQLKIGELAKALNVSANPVREALRQLEAEGMVQFLHNRRIEVVQLSQEDLNDVYSIMIPLEEIALEKCFDLIDDAGIKRLETVCEKMMDPGLHESEWMELNLLFHRTIHQATQSPRLASILKGLRANITPYLYISFGDKGRIKQANIEHNHLVQVLKDGNLAKAKRLLSAHLSHGCTAICKLLTDENETNVI